MFNRPEHVDNYKSISALKYKVNKAEVPQYVEEFEHVARDDVLMIANISLEEIQVCGLVFLLLSGKSVMSSSHWKCVKIRRYTNFYAELVAGVFSRHQIATVRKYPLFSPPKVYINVDFCVSQF